MSQCSRIGGVLAAPGRARKAPSALPRSLAASLELGRGPTLFRRHQLATHIQSRREGGGGGLAAEPAFGSPRAGCGRSCAPCKGSQVPQRIHRGCKGSRHAAGAPRPSAQAAPSEGDFPRVTLPPRAPPILLSRASQSKSSAAEGPRLGGAATSATLTAVAAAQGAARPSVERAFARVPNSPPLFPILSCAGI